MRKANRGLQTAVVVMRFLAAILIGMVALFILAESVEFLVVQLAAGAWTTEPKKYFEVRNRPWILNAKFAYQSAATVIAGYLAAVIAGRGRERLIGWSAGVVQSAMFIVALLTPELRRNAPDWVWLMLIPVTLIGFYAGANARLRQVTAR